MASIDRPRPLRPAAPTREPAKITLVKREPAKVDLVKREPAKVDLVKRVSLVKRRDPDTRGPGTVVVRRPSPAHLRAVPRRITLANATRVITVVARAPGRGARATRAWTRRPSGRAALPGLLMAVLVMLAAVTGVFLPRTTDARPPAAASPEESAPEDAADLPDDDGGLSFPDPSEGAQAGGQRPSDALTVWAAPMSVKTGIPVVALQAYAYAELSVAQTRTSCNLRWTTLAGIGRNESNHGRANGATLTNEGRATPAIYGPPLDGQNGTEAIADTDAGRYDNDRAWDRAIGPMQFIPSTWVRYAVDADGDGVSDPQDIDDAALASANYLCASARDLSTADGWWAAILAYNNVQVYAQNVFNAANDYGISSRT